MWSIFLQIVISLAAVAVMFALGVAICWAFAVVPELLSDRAAARLRMRDCVACRDHYPVCWLEPCTTPNHYFGYDCTGIEGEIMLCERHDERYWNIRRLERSLLARRDLHQRFVDALAAKLSS